MLEHAEPALFIPLIAVVWAIWIIVKVKEKRRRAAK